MNSSLCIQSCLFEFKTFVMKPMNAPATPKYQQIADELRHQLREGVLRPGDRLPSLAEMQASHQASRPTVESAHALLEKENLIVKRHGAGVFVRKPEQRAAQGVIGLSGACFSFNGYSSYWAQIMGGVRDAVSAAGLQLLILDPKISDGWEKADGVLLCDWNDSRTPRPCPPGLPLVSLLAPVEGVASVVADDAGGMRAATEYLISQGHRQIAYLHAYDGQSIASNRLAGYHGALQTAGIEEPKQWTRYLYGLYDFGVQFTNVARDTMQYWIEHGWSTLGCTALLCHNDEAALGAMQALTAAGIRVPEDVSVIGFDGTSFCDLVSPKLSSIELPLREIGAASVEMLLRQIEADEVRTEHKILPTQLRVRESTAAPSRHS